MKSPLRHVAERLRADTNRAYIRRVMWIDFEERLSVAFQALCSDEGSCSQLGGVFLTTSMQRSVGNHKAGLQRSELLNSAQIHCGTRDLGVYCLEPRQAQEVRAGAAPASLSLVTEHGAAIVFSQNVAGTIAVLLYPYESSAAKVNESNILLDFDLDPIDLDNRKIEKYLATFFRYCNATSAQSFRRLDLYLFRLTLVLRDFRNRRVQSKALLVFGERVLLVGLAILAVWAELYGSDKWPPWR